MSNDTELRERQLWTMMRAVEERAIALYEIHAPELVTAEKKDVLGRLQSLGESIDFLAETPLMGPLSDLLSTFEDRDTFALFVNGLVLEQLGATIYAHIAETESMSEAGRELARLGEPTSTKTRDGAAAFIAKNFSEDPFAIFARETTIVLSKLDSLGEVVDSTFGEIFDIRFADVLGDLTSELLPVCMDLGMVRRKLVVHLTSAFMSAA